MRFALSGVRVYFIMVGVVSGLCTTTHKPVTGDGRKKGANHLFFFFFLLLWNCLVSMFK